MRATSALLFVFGFAADPLTAQAPALTAFADGFLASLSPRDSIARGALVIVDRNGPVVHRGFGRTAAGDAVDPARTIFRAASNSKVFVASAAVQLAQRGQWRLEDDANRYLPAEARLAGSPGRAVTIADLLTHTSGLEVKFEGAIASAATRLTLAEFFARYTPARNTEPGRDIAYSNTGMALAGYLVERASGVGFATYVERNIFVPLGMTRSSFDQPAPAAWARDVASPTPRGARGIVFNPYPAASLVTTPDDMGRFIQAHLAHGATASGRILDSASVDMMQAPHWRAQPDAVGAAFGFFEGMAAGHRYLFHTGDSGDHSLVLLVPDLGVGLYFVYAGRDDQAPIRERLAHEFLARFAGTSPRPSPPPATSVSLDAFAGSYRTAGFSSTNYEKLRSLAARVRVRLAGDAIAIDAPGGASAVTLHRVSDFTFRGDSGEVVAFQPDPDSVVRRFTLSGSVWDPASWDRVRWYEHRAMHLALFAFWLGVVLLRAVVVPPWRWMTARMRRSRGTPVVAAADSAVRRRWWRASGIGAWLILLAPVIGFARAMTSFSIPAEGITKGIHAAGIAVGLGALAMLVSAVTLSVRPRAGQRNFMRVAGQMMTAASVAGLILIGYWRLLPV